MSDSGNLVDGRKARPTQAVTPHSLLRVGWQSHVGQIRDLNEDALFTFVTHFEQGDEQQTLGLFIIADGMGGYAHGEIASRMAARTVAEEIVRRLVQPLLTDQPMSEPLYETMTDAVHRAHEHVQNHLPGSGTTLTAALIVNDSLAIAHVGDSRAYLDYEGAVEQLTPDHSLVARLVELGQITTAQAAVDSRRNLLYRVLGQAEPLEVDFQFHAFPVGSRLLLCSDGLWGLMNPDQLVQILRQSSDPQTNCRALVDYANEMGGTDNITAIVVMHV